MLMHFSEMFTDRSQKDNFIAHLELSLGSRHVSDWWSISGIYCFVWSLIGTANNKFVSQLRPLTKHSSALILCQEIRDLCWTSLGSPAGVVVASIIVAKILRLNKIYLLLHLLLLCYNGTLPGESVSSVHSQFSCFGMQPLVIDGTVFYRPVALCHSTNGVKAWRK